jgi:hypothetical protein
MAKPELEFFDPTFDNSRPWVPVPGYPKGIYEKILTIDPPTGPWRMKTRFIHFQAGIETKETLCHDYWEEVYLIDGYLIDIAKNQTFKAGMYCCRPPGMKHGPYKIPFGVTAYEVHYYLDKK